MTTKDIQLFSVKEIAERLNRHPSYVYAMKRKGCPFIHGRIDMDKALDWLQKNPSFSQHGSKKHKMA